MLCLFSGSALMAQDQSIAWLRPHFEQNLFLRAQALNTYLIYEETSERLFSMLPVDIQTQRTNPAQVNPFSFVLDRISRSGRILLSKDEFLQQMNTVCLEVGYDFDHLREVLEKYYDTHVAWKNAENDLSSTFGTEVHIALKDNGLTSFDTTSNPERIHQRNLIMAEHFRNLTGIQVDLPFLGIVQRCENIL